MLAQAISHDPQGIPQLRRILIKLQIRGTVGVVKFPNFFSLFEDKSKE